MATTLIQIETSEPAAELLAVFKLLSEPRRFQIVRSLLRAERCVCELIDELGMTQSLASHHLATLRRAGLIRARREGQWVYYSVDPDRLAAFARAFGALFDSAALPDSARYGASSACVGVPRDEAAGPCCARHEHRQAAPVGLARRDVATHG